MVSDIRKKKVLHAFHNYFDLDRSGTINIKDSDVYVKKQADYLKLKPGDPKYKELKDQWHEVWEGMIKDIDADGDGDLRLPEWVAYWDRMAKDPNMKPEWFDLFAKIAFSFQKDPKIGKITTDSHCKALSIYGFGPTECAAAFNKLSSGKGVIDLNEYQHLWRDYFTSDDPNAPGNFLAGLATF